MAVKVDLMVSQIGQKWSLSIIIGNDVIGPTQENGLAKREKRIK